MKLNVGFQMDPIEGLNVSEDSTLAIMLECLSNKYRIWQFQPSDVSYLNGRVFADAKHIFEINESKTPFFKSSKREKINLESLDMIFVRQDPPFDISYITSTYLLEYIEKKVKIINKPSEIRNSPEKLLLNKWHDLTPKTLISRNFNEIYDFKKKYKDIIVKPLYGNGGHGVILIKKDDKNFHSLIEMFMERNNEQFILQEFIPEITKGDKRIILINGQPLGAINRIPGDDDVRANLHVGGKAHKTSLSKKEKDICKTIGPYLKKKGLLFVGIDVIGGKLTEINVTSPTGLKEIYKLNNVNLAKNILGLF